jgi:hypothetical protein
MMGAFLPVSVTSSSHSIGLSSIFVVWYTVLAAKANQIKDRTYYLRLLNQINLNANVCLVSDLSVNSNHIDKNVNRIVSLSPRRAL